MSRKRCPAVTPLRNNKKPDFESSHMSKVKPKIDNHFIPSSDPVCQVADLLLIASVTASGLIAAVVELVRMFG